MTKLKIDENSVNYACSVVKITELFPIEGADRIVRCVIFGNNIIVGKDVNIGDIVLYFQSGTQLSEDVCKNNDLYTDAELNLNKEKKGYISPKKRLVKAIKLRGIISDGMLLPIDALKTIIPTLQLTEGDSFTHINDIEICKKYVVPVRSGGGTGEKKVKVNKLKELMLDNQFRFHHETEHFAKNLHKFKPESEIIITRKIHGSSLILANVLVVKSLKWWEKLFKKIIPLSEYGIIYSSGKPKGKLPKGIESPSNVWETPNQSFYTDNIWARAYKEIGEKVEKGVSIYAEIVGQGIQGEKYTYGHEYAIFVYRITATNIDGQVYEFSWEQIKAYCEKYGLRHVEEYFVGKINELVSDNRDLLEHLQSKYLNKSYNDCEIDEGICIRLRNTDEIFKLKSPNFILQENIGIEEGIQNIEDN